MRLRDCAAKRKVVSKIPDGVIGIFIDLIESLLPHADPGVDSASNRYKHQGHILCLTL